MMNIKGIFAVSLIAMVAVVAGAHTSNAVAAIASKGYVDEQVGSKLSSISGSTTGSGNVVTSVSASGSTVSATKGITAEETKNKVTSVRAVASATDTAYPSEKAVATALAGKEVTSNKVTSANYAANVSNDTKYPTVKAVADAIADVEKKIPAAITVDSALSSTSTNPVQNKVINSALAGKEVTSNKVTSANYAANVSNDTKYPTVKAVADALAGKEATSNKVTSVRAVASATNTAYPSEKAVATALAGKADATDLAHKVDIYQGDAKANQAVITNGSGNIITGFITKSMLGEDVVIPDEYELPPATTSALGGVKSGGDINVSTAGVVTVANGVIDASALGTNSVATVKIQDGAVTTAKIYDGAVTADKIAPGVIPTVPTVNNATLTIKKNGESVGTFTANASVDKEIDIEVPDAGDILTTTTVTSSGTGAVLTGVSVTDGKVTLQKGNVQIPSGGQNATSYVSIWVE